MELVESRGVQKWNIGTLGTAGEKPVGFMMMFDATLKIMVSVEELESMQVAINKALAVKDIVI